MKGHYYKHFPPNSTVSSLCFMLINWSAGRKNYFFLNSPTAYFIITDSHGCNLSEKIEVPGHFKTNQPNTFLLKPCFLI